MKPRPGSKSAPRGERSEYRLPVSLIRETRALAAVRGVTPSDVVAKAVDEYLAREHERLTSAA